ncbi:hypothetical protein [Flaviaesturariibacter aridisoli]|uniref:Uncharacterized protein n=1 Tax=Flaviaesturariibacter aridisoli TaxID=2545761 RepID=A0A4R4E524_9BACT|nr:hypothetical protein [Flaviaesturariibacter aridisoli]TCZ74087.1 hypothetical protein E0486_03155 [Flaviaesturariibacter aridisoli]
MRKRPDQPTTEALTVRNSALTVVHSTRQQEPALTKVISGAPALNPAPVYYSASYTKDGPGGNYQGF